VYPSKKEEEEEEKRKGEREAFQRSAPTD